MRYTVVFLLRSHEVRDTAGTRPLRTVLHILDNIRDHHGICYTNESDRHEAMP